MRDDYCFLCASDEGVFLDVYSDPRFLGKIQCCLTSKYTDKDSISSNVCYKCAFEVDQCSEFVNKYRLSRKNHKKKTPNACCLCLEPGVDGQIFDLVKERHSTNDPFQKMRDIFQFDVPKSRTQSLLVCTGCRYCLDVLYDLKLVYEATSPKIKDLIIKGNKNVKVPKTKTQVISRKTTTNAFQQKGVHLMSDTDSDSSTVNVRRTRKNNLGGTDKKNRQCEKCEAVVENGVSMFRYHRTGLTVCKDCWSSEEPAGKSTGRKRTNPKNTRKCSVFLKDVFDNDALYKVEKDEFGNTTYIITDEGSESDERPAKRMRSQVPDNKRDIKKLNLRAKPGSLKRSQSQTEGSSSEESSGRRTRKTETLSDGDNKARRSKRKLSPVEEVIDLTSSKRTRRSSNVTVQSAQFKSPTAKKSETKTTRRATRRVEVKSEEPSTSSSKLNRRQRKKIIEEIEIKEEVDETGEEMKEDEEQNYECKQCGLEFESKSDKVNHLLTHSKNVTLKLHRVKTSSSTDVEIKEEIVEDDSDPVNQDEQSDVVKISKANENADIDIEGNDSNGSDEPEDVNSISKTEEGEATEKVQENCTIETAEKAPSENLEEETKNNDEKEEQSREESVEKDAVEKDVVEKDTIEKDAIEKDETIENDTELEKEKKDEVTNEAADDKESETEKEETADKNEDSESKDGELSEKHKKESTPDDETVENEERILELENDKEEGKKEMIKAKDSDSDAVDLHLSQSENGSPDDRADETVKEVAEIDEDAPVNGCSISKDNEETEESNETGKENNVSSVTPLDSTMEDN